MKLQPSLMQNRSNNTVNKKNNPKSTVMKITLIATVLMCFFLESYSQVNHYQLAIETEDSTGETPELLIFKPNKLLRIKTKEGLTFASSQYTVAEKYLVINNHDTIPLDQIKTIQGKVYKDAATKVFGVLITAIATPLIAFCILDTAIEGGPEIILAVPFIAMARSGIRLAGARKFRLSHNYHIRVIEQKSTVIE
jgi:hypothetical protein